MSGPKANLRTEQGQQGLLATQCWCLLLAAPHRQGPRAWRALSQQGGGPGWCLELQAKEESKGAKAPERPFCH